MPDPSESSKSAAEITRKAGDEQVVRLVIEAQTASGKRWGTRLLMLLLFLSVMLNFMLISAQDDLFTELDGPMESYLSGDREAEQKIAVIRVSATIMPPFTERILDQIEHATEDDNVKGMVLVVDSPGGLVADSHQMYHRLQKFSEKKPLYVQMQRIAASGGYYIAMGVGEKGKIFAEPTTWTGSIGVIIPHYNAVELASKVGIKSEPLTTGEFKDSLSSFKPISDRDREVWDAIIDEAFQKFLGVIQSGRPNLTRAQIEELATGQVFTADQALNNGMVDGISFLDDTISTLEKDLDLGPLKAIEYEYAPSLTEILMGAKQTSSEWQLLQNLLASPAPHAFYMLGLDDSTARLQQSSAN
ncbi:MAG: signal peptide peptidase SppA [Planctomycetaceae bacterium]|nr:signal peptide peptidase SppA [Planctomycetaceae bacterium]